MAIDAGPKSSGALDVEQHFPFWIVEIDGLCILQASAALLEALGYSPDEMRSIALSDLIAPEDVPVVRAVMGRLVHTASDAGTWRLRRASGAWWPVSIRWHKVIHDGAPAALGILEDASSLVSLEGEHDALQQRLREQEANLRLAQQLLDIGIWKLEIATGRLIWSENVYRICGVSSNIFDPCFDAYVALVHPDDRADMVAQYEDFESSDATEFEFTHRLLRPDGSIVHIRGAAEREGTGGPGWLTGVFQDVTTEVYAREKLSEASRMQRIAKRAARLGGWRVDLNPTCITWSRETCEIHEMPEGTSPSLDAAFSYYLPDHREPIRKAFAACAGSGQSFDEIAQLVTARGRRVWVRAIGEPVRNEEGTIIAVQGAFQDISEMVAMRDQSEGLARRLQQTLESISDAFFLLDHDWRISYLNGQAESLLHRSREELLGEVVWDEFPEAVGSTFQSKYETAVRTGCSVRFQEYFPPLKSWFEVDAYPTPEGLAVYFRDVTQKHARDEHLRLLEAAVSRQNDILLITEAEPIDAPGGPRIVYVNNAFVKRTGFSRDEVIGKTPRILQGPKTQRAELDRIRQAMEKWRPVRAELINYTKAGEEFWLELDIVPLADETGWFTHWVSIERDISERKRTEEATHRSEERFRLVVKASNDVIWDWDLCAGTVWWSENLKSFFGHDPAQVEPGPEFWRNRVHPEDKEWILNSIDTAISGSTRTWTEEYRFLHADGYPLTVVDRAFVVRDAEGKAVRMLGSMADVTGERETERRLRQAQKLEAVGQLTGGVAHDFNNLLTVILGNAEILSDELTGQQQLRMLADMTATAAERGAELTKRLLAFSRNQPLEPRLTDVGALIQGMEDLLRRTLTENIDIEIVLAGGLWKAEIDPSQVETSVLNLALNARDAMPQGGSLTIETANAALDDDYAAREQDVQPGQYVVITVTDTGQGIPTDVLARIFEPFFTTKEIGKGSGLGLSMVYGFVKQSRGNVRVYSEPGEGTSVKLYFPRAYGTAAYSGVSGTGKHIVGGEETILVVEDDTLVREYLVAQLRGLGYHVVDASSGARAVEILRQMQQIDLLFTDVVMPGGMNGRELADTARALRPDLKVLFTSGYTENAIVHHGRLDPGVELLSKPYRRELLAAKVRKVLNSG